MRRLAVVGVILAVAVLSRGAAGQEAKDENQNRGVRFYGLGPRAGFSIDPDQFVFGGHADFGDPFPHITWLLPVVEIGIGDNQTLTSIGTDLLYRLYDRWGAWTPYLGGELDFLIDNVDLPDGTNDTSTDIGLMGIFGVQKGLGDNLFALEMKFQIVDSPNFKLAAIWTFGH
jgi:hypothetical protein